MGCWPASLPATRMRAGGREVDAEPAGLSRQEPTRNHKISHNPTAIKRLLVDSFLEAHERAPSRSS